MKVEDATLFIHIWGITGLGSGISRGGRIRGGGLLGRLLSLHFPPFVAPVSTPLGLGTPLSFFPVLLSYYPLPIDASGSINTIFPAQKQKIRQRTRLYPEFATTSFRRQFSSSQTLRQGRQ